MLLLVTLRELFAYNYWARDRQLEACAVLSPDDFQRPLHNSFPSIRDTLSHLVGAEWVWLERLRGRSPEALPEIGEFPTLEAIQDRWRAVEQGIRKYLACLREEDLSSYIIYTNFSGEAWRYSIWMVLLHLANHQTYHRGQVTTLLRQLGAHPPALDLLAADDAGLFRGALQKGGTRRADKSLTRELNQPGSQ